MIFLKVFILAIVISNNCARPRPIITVFDETARQIFEAPAVRSSNQFMIAHESVPINYFPNSYDNSALYKPMRTDDGKENTNEAHSNTPQKQRCYEEDEESAESQVATDVNTRTARDGKECYFEHERLNPDGLEKNERPDQSKVSNKCRGELRSFEELADSKALLDLFGAENNADLALIRGAAEFGNDFDDEAVKERMKNIFICENHEKELVYRWKTWTDPRHTFIKHVSQTTKPACTVPNALLDKHGSSATLVLAKSGRFLRKNQAEAFLRETGTHLQIGIPMCLNHADYIDRWQIKTAIKKDGLEVMPDVDYAGTAKVEQSISGYTEQSSVQSAYCSPKASGSSQDSTGHRTSEYYRTPKVEKDPVITERMKSTLRAFLKEIGVERLFLKTKPIEKLKLDTLRKKGDSLRRIRQTVYKIVAPGHERVLEEMDCRRDSNGVWTTGGSEKLQLVMNEIAERYAESAEWPARRALLALVAPILSFAELEKFIPGLTHYRYTMARNYARGMSEPYVDMTGRGVRNRFSPGRVQEFIDFITSDAIMIGLPYGSISAKTSSGDKFEIASTLRLHRNEHITQMYERYLESAHGSDHGKGISRSAMWKILDACSAHRKKAITGLDEFVASGRDGFDHIYQMLQSMLERGHEDRDFVDMAIKRLKESHQYLEGDFKLHVKETSKVADHCIRFALSDPDDEKFASPCEGPEATHPHEHDTVCDRCEQLKSVLGEVRDHVLKYPLPDNEKERVKAKYLAAEKAIMEMRRHQLRSVLSSNTRKDIVEQLGTEGYVDALVTLDWAMKWLPTKARETQKDFFGKKGISWHITHVLRRDPEDKKLKQRTLVHITDQDLQDSDAVLAILRHVLLDLKRFDVKSIVLRSDNAGCYKNSMLLGTMKKISEETDVFISRYTFSEAQAGKSSCDRMAAVVKRKLRDYIDQGKDVTNADEFIKAMKSATKIVGMNFFSGQVERLENDRKTEKPSKPKVTHFNDYFFYDDGIQAKKYSGIGTGKEIEKRYWQGLEISNKFSIRLAVTNSLEKPIFEWSPLDTICHIVTKCTLSNNLDSELENEEQQPEEQQPAEQEIDSGSSFDIIDDENTLEKDDEQEYFDCPEPGCIKRFAHYGNLQRHIIIGKHKLAIERKTMRDFALNSFQINIAGNSENRIRLQESVEIVNGLKTIEGQPPLFPSRGWAIKTPRVNTRFSGKIRKYLNDAFKRGVKNRNEKVDAKQLAKQMEAELQPGKTTHRFAPNELLTETQIASYFSTKKRQMRNQKPDCLDDLESDKCSSVDEQSTTSEGEGEQEHAEDPMFYSVDDESRASIVTQENSTMNLSDIETTIFQST